ncbi:MAG: hypothetical protein ACRDZ4_10045 [Egibacteraceae bacterium]
MMRPCGSWWGGGWVTTSCGGLWGGGMATVYEGYQPSLGRVVAVKVLADPELL